jgi:hypothetical protein
MRSVDREALQRAIDMTLAESDWAVRIMEKLAEDGFEQTGEFCAFHQQIRHLRLQPWQDPPCLFTANDKPDPTRDAGCGEAEAIALCKLLRAVGLSRFEPDPLAALARA